MATVPKRSFLVVAIDFGTTYSGYAFSFKSEFNKDPGKISCNQWVAGSNQLISLKTPTALLLKWHGDLKAFTAEGFGYEAEDKYTALVEDDKHADYYLVRRFKMDLYKQTAATGLSRNQKMKLARKRSITRMRVFSMCISYLKDHFMASLEKRAAKVKMDDIRWVLTVPAIWTDGAKQFMRESAVMAEIDTENLSIALEPEAASLYCLHLPALNSDSTDETESRFPVGTKYMVVDCGGGTIDVCVHEVVGDRTIIEKHVASGGDWGGTVVDENFIQIWTEIVGQEVFERFRDKHKENVTEIYRDFEFKKRSMKLDQEKMTIRIPLALVKLYQEMKGFDFENAVSGSKYVDGITIHLDKIKIDTAIIRKCFNDPVRKTVEHVKSILKDTACNGVDTIILVGGFAESCYLQEAFGSNFSAMKVVIPEDPGLAVVKGAVLFGHDPLMNQSRFAKYTYGMRTTSEFTIVIPSESSIRRERGRRNRQAKTDWEALTFHKHNDFSIHAKKGAYLPIGQPQKSVTYAPFHPDQTQILLDFFVSAEETPNLVTDASCSRIGSVMVDLPDTAHGRDRPVSVTMIFGGTEIEVHAVEERTKRVTKAWLNLLK